ncbi:ADP-ribosylglycohydrolase family protein [Agromyces sp. CCNWLW203]|uniref:ADP-ribosylglycohydrolase family protein n=1 Tax=Agromyces sp. CCNWLW203 TaxID=3112842 RepID=UPI002F965F4D
MSEGERATKLRDQVNGCWMGKAVGGTLGQTFEGLQGPIDVDYYFPVPTEMVPNDDLDLQVLFACKLAELVEPSVSRHLLAQAWADHVAFPWNEYGVGMRNLAEGILPPHTGSFDNWFAAGEGAAIRSELWACLAPGDPDRAAAYAYEDACFDHAGVGIDAEVFLARLQSLAFVEDDTDTLLDGALAGLSADSEIRAVVQDTRGWVAEGLHWREVRERIMAKYGRSDFTDVRPNTGFVVLGWLAGSNFSERITICNNCGQDTDSSTASLGALLGILDPTAIDERWLTPIGTDLVLNDEITGITPPPTIDGFTDLVLDLAERLEGRYPDVQEADFAPADYAIPVELGFTNGEHGKWQVRDYTELPQLGGASPADRVEFRETTLPGTWVHFPREQFEDSILVMRLRFDARGRDRARLMFNSSEHFRIWLDGEFLHGSQGSQYMFPAPDKAPAGQYIDLSPTPGVHELLVAVKRPPADRDYAEWIIALVEQPSAMWIEHAFRPGRA